MDKLNLTVKDHTGKQQFRLSVFHFKEDKIHIIHNHTLDLSGYGKNEVEAKASFQEVFSGFLEYAETNGTLTKELEKLNPQSGS